MNIQSVNGTAPGNVGTPRQNTLESANAARPPTEQLAKAAAVTQQAPLPVKEGQPSRDQLDKAVKSVNDFVNSVNNSLQFSVDDDTGKTIVKVIDSATKEVIKQFPSEEMLAIAKALDHIKGLLIHQKA